MSYADISIVIAGIVAIAAIATFFARASLYLTLREHEAYMKTADSIITDIDRRLTRLENKTFNGK